MKVYVYWIHNINHTNPYTEGYIGISTKPINRFKYHSNLKCADNYPLYEAIKKGAVQTILHEFKTREEALEREIEYRPKEKIGWNIIPGGTDVPSRKGKPSPMGMLGKTHKEESNQKRSCSMKVLKWWNNGLIQVRLENCPEGYLPGRLKTLSRKSPKHTSVSSTKVKTPLGEFNSITEAAKTLGLSWDKVNSRIKSKNKKWSEWVELGKSKVTNIRLVVESD